MRTNQPGLTRISTQPWLLRMALFLLVLPGLVFLSGAAPTPEPQLAEPPLPPVEMVAAQTAPITTAALSCSGPGDCFYTYLPIIFNPQTESLERAAAKDLFIQQFLTSENVSHEWTGNKNNCTPGTTSQAFRDAVLRRVNYFRVMAGVPAVKSLNTDYNSKAQAAALMMSANNTLDHTPPSNWTCYSNDGSVGAGKSNLALGATGPGAISLYIRDPGSSNTAVGHRRWILYPQTQYMGTGDIPSTAGSASNALYVFDTHLSDPRPTTRERFVAWPPAGYVPYQVVYPRWSFSYPGASFSQTMVTLSVNGSPVGVTIYAPSYNTYGENTLVWNIDGMTDWSAWPKPGADTVYTVALYNVSIGGILQNFTYTVTIFDPAQ
jgi:uncharacterized protein YkwD